MKRVLFLLALAAQVLYPVSGVDAAPANTEHLPDLQTLKPSDLSIDTSGGVKNLRFSNTVVNLGSGRLELRPSNPSLFSSLLGSQGTTRAYQVIYTHDAAGTWRKVREIQIGTFQFHSAHNHWHFEKFARYELYNSAPDGSRGTSLNRLAEKTTFCIIDTHQVSTTIEHASPQRYTACGRDSTTGLSVGWGDKYGSNLDGQWVDVKGLPDGDYYLVSTADYADRILESNNSNNVAEVKFRMIGNAITLLS